MEHSCDLRSRNQEQEVVKHVSFYLLLDRQKKTRQRFELCNTDVKERRARTWSVVELRRSKYGRLNSWTGTG